MFGAGRAVNIIQRRQPDRLRALVDDLIRRQVAVIVRHTGRDCGQNRTTTIPVVFYQRRSSEAGLSPA